MGSAMAVLMPIRRPLPSKSTPPELPGLIAAALTSAVSAKPARWHPAASLCSTCICLNDVPDWDASVPRRAQLSPYPAHNALPTACSGSGSRVPAARWVHRSAGQVEHVDQVNRSCLLYVMSSVVIHRPGSPAAPGTCCGPIRRRHQVQASVDGEVAWRAAERSKHSRLPMANTVCPTSRLAEVPRVTCLSSAALSGGQSSCKTAMSLSGSPEMNCMQPECEPQAQGREREGA